MKTRIKYFIGVFDRIPDYVLNSNVSNNSNHTSFYRDKCKIIRFKKTLKTKNRWQFKLCVYLNTLKNYYTQINKANKFYRVDLHCTITEALLFYPFFFFKLFYHVSLFYFIACSLYCLLILYFNIFIHMTNA